MAIKAPATNNFVPLREIRSDVIILKDGSLRAVLIASSINFALKSTDEQTAIIGQFQNFLNSLDFSVQIVIQSRELDIRPYIIFLESRLSEQTSEILKLQIREYIEFVKSFTESQNIMTKNFYAVIPYDSVNLLKSGAVSSIFSKKGIDLSKESPEQFEERRSQLEQRVGVVEGGLARCGVRSVRLGTSELVELFYKIFDPGSLGKPMKLGEEPEQAAEQKK